MTARVLPGTRVRMGALDCEVLSTVRCGDRLRANLDCAGERIPDVPVDLLTIVARHGTSRNINWRDWHDTD
jgi:hypothetical protein